jgi:aminoglycoside 3-N-acetyltransferase I
MKSNKLDIQIKRLEKDDVPFFRSLIEVFIEVFEQGSTAPAPRQHLTRVLRKPSIIAYAIFYNNEIIGGLTAHELPNYYSEKPEIFIYDVAVKAAYQGKGYGKKLFAALNDYCKENNIKSSFVSVDKEDKKALRFYRVLGGKEKNVFHFDFTT